MLGRVRQIIRFDVADVDAAHFDDALVACDARVKLAVPHVERDHMRGTASQKHVAETAGGRADVEAIESFRGTQARLGEHVERADQLVGSTGDVIVSQIGIKRVGGRDFERRFGCDDAVHPDLAGFDQPLCFGAAVRDATLHQRDVESDDGTGIVIHVAHTHVRQSGDSEFRHDHAVDAVSAIRRIPHGGAGRTKTVDAGDVGDVKTIGRRRTPARRGSSKRQPHARLRGPAR